MPLEDPSAPRVQAPARAGIGLRGPLLRARLSRPPTSWPEDWWQRDYDHLESMDYSPPPFTDRMLNLPPAPEEPTDE